MEGTYPLPEAQLDRFFFKLHVPFPTREELHAILERTTTDHTVEIVPVLDRGQILEMQKLVRTIAAAHHVQDYAVRLLQATHPELPDATETVKRFVRTGASPRGVQSMLMAAKVRALLEGRFAIGFDDIKECVTPALRHRLLLNFEGEAEGIRPDDIISEVLEKLPTESA
jgi:MoxR-like ATPase